MATVPDGIGNGKAGMLPTTVCRLAGGGRHPYALQSSSMSTAEKVARGGIGVGMGEVIEKGSMFLRNLILARMLAPADFGLGATFVTTYLLFMMVSSFSTSQYLVQSDSGGDEDLQKSIHSLELIRGIVSALGLYFCAGWIASLFGAPEAKGAFQLLALIPIMLGLVHTDIYRFHRWMDFRPSIFTAVASDVASLAAAYPAALYWGDYTAPLACMLIKIMTYLVLSQLLAGRRFRFGWSLPHLRGLWRFGWPLLLNGALLFLTLQGDRVIIGSGKQLFDGSRFTLSDLGAFSVAFSFTWIPTVMAIKVVTKVLLPYLSQVKRDSAALSTRLLTFFPFATVYSVGISVVFILCGGLIIAVCCGERYLVDEYLIVWLAASNAVRVVRGLVGLSLLATGDTRNYLKCNVIRATTFFVSLVVSAAGLYLHWIAFAIFLGELLSFLFQLYIVRKKHRISLRGGAVYLGLLAVLIPGLILLNSFLGPYNGMIEARLVLAFLIMGLVSVGILVLMGETYRKNMIQMFRNIKNDIRIEF